ncbi:hypothetical protein GCM10017687_72180 [Streptomyces echinatus]
MARKRGRLRGTDFGRLLVLVNEDADCYAVLGELHTCMTPVVAEFKDFIAVPKFNLYQSLHTAVALSRKRTDPPGGTPGAAQVVEVLIRTHQMHKVAEAGVVALGNPYAPASETSAAGAATTPAGTSVPETADAPADGERADPTRPGWLSRLLDWQRAAPDPDTFWSTPARGPRPGPARSPCSAPTAAPSACPRAPRAWTPRTRRTARTPTPVSAPVWAAAWPPSAPSCATATPCSS